MLFALLDVKAKQDLELDSDGFSFFSALSVYLYSRTSKLFQIVPKVDV